MLEDLAVQSLLTINISLTCANSERVRPSPGSTEMYDEDTWQRLFSLASCLAPPCIAGSGDLLHKAQAHVLIHSTNLLKSNFAPGAGNLGT